MQYRLSIASRATTLTSKKNRMNFPHAAALALVGWYLRRAARPLFQSLFHCDIGCEFVRLSRFFPWSGTPVCRELLISVEDQQFATLATGKG